MSDEVPCPLDCPGKRCALKCTGEDRLDQSGQTYLPAKRYTREDCALCVVYTRATGEPARVWEGHH